MPLNVRERNAKFLEALSGIGKPSTRMTPLQRLDAEQAMMRSDPVRALLCIIEALADDRAENDLAGWAKQAKIRELAAKAIEHHTGAPFANPIFP